MARVTTGQHLGQPRLEGYLANLGALDRECHIAADLAFADIVPEWPAEYHQKHRHPLAEAQADRRLSRSRAWSGPHLWTPSVALGLGSNSAQEAAAGLLRLELVEVADPAVEVAVSPLSALKQALDPEPQWP